MRGIQAATNPRMRCAWATTPCWGLLAETSPWNSSIADHIHCYLACTSTMGMEHLLRVQIHDRLAIQVGGKHGPSTSGATPSTRVFRCEFRQGPSQRISRVVRRSGHIFWESFAGCGNATV